MNTEGCRGFVAIMEYCVYCRILEGDVDLTKFHKNTLKHWCGHY